MVVVSGPAIATGVIVCLFAGGGGLYAILKWANGGEDFPSISNSSFGFAQWEHRNNNDLIGHNFDFESEGILFEIGMIAMGFFIVFLCFCCGCRHLPQPNCLKERKHRKKTKKREKARRKREKRLEEEEMIKERRRRKALMRHMKHKQKLIQPKTNTIKKTLVT